MLRDVTVSFAPHISERLSTRSVMIDIIIALVPAIAAAGYYYRLYALILIATCIISAVATEWICNLIRKRPRPFESIGDFSAVVTGLILALSLPPALPAWAAVIGTCFAIAVGKMVFGGLGANIFNPAMVGRAFLTACFGVLMTTWMMPATIDSSMPEIAADNTVNALTQATPLAWSKQAIKANQKARAYAKEIAEAKKKVESDTKAILEVEQKTNAYNKAKAEAEKCIQIVNQQFKATFTGEVGGCLGESSGLVILLGGLYLLIRKTINIHIPLAVLISAFVFASVAYLTNPDAYISPVAHLTSGGILLGAFFIATDPVTAPLSTRGMWIFGAGVGAITMLIRIVGEYPEGVMYAVLLMNAVSPLIDRLCKTAPFGGRPNV